MFLKISLNATAGPYRVQFLLLHRSGAGRKQSKREPPRAQPSGYQACAQRDLWPFSATDKPGVTRTASNTALPLNLPCAVKECVVFFVIGVASFLPVQMPVSQKSFSVPCHSVNKIQLQTGRECDMHLNSSPRWPPASENRYLRHTWARQTASK